MIAKCIDEQSELDRELKYRMRTPEGKEFSCQALVSSAILSSHWVHIALGFSPLQTILQTAQLPLLVSKMFVTELCNKQILMFTDNNWYRLAEPSPNAKSFPINRPRCLLYCQDLYEIYNWQFGITAVYSSTTSHLTFDCADGFS